MAKAKKAAAAAEAPAAATEDAGEAPLHSLQFSFHLHTSLKIA